MTLIPFRILYKKALHHLEDLEWLAQLQQVVRKEIPNFQLTVALLAKDMSISKRGLEVKIKSLTGLSPSQYIQEARYNEAHARLQSGKVKTIKNLAFQLGMKDTSHFSKLFKQRFGRLPSEFFDE